MFRTAALAIFALMLLSLIACQSKPQPDAELMKMLADDHRELDRAVFPP